MPIRGDSRLVAAAVRSYYDDWLACGARVFEYRPAMLHAKTMVIDRELAVVGSANVDNRSFRLNFEIVAAIYGEEAADHLTEEFEDDLRTAPARSALATSLSGAAAADSGRGRCAALQRAALTDAPPGHPSARSTGALTTDTSVLVH